MEEKRAKIRLAVGNDFPDLEITGKTIGTRMKNYVWELSTVSAPNADQGKRPFSVTLLDPSLEVIKYWIRGYVDNQTYEGLDLPALDATYHTLIDFTPE